jgi:hypothetical protein
MPISDFRNREDNSIHLQIKSPTNAKTTKKLTSQTARGFQNQSKSSQHAIPINRATKSNSFQIATKQIQTIGFPQRYFNQIRDRHDQNSSLAKNSLSH